MSIDLSYPEETKEREEVNFRLGIKSSLSQLRKVFALLYSVYLVNNRRSSVNYSVENQENDKIYLIIDDDIFLSLKDFFNIVDDDIEGFRAKVNSNPLFTSQIESLQMALETFWRLAEISFLVKPEANTRERTGGNRFNKVIQFSTNVLLLDNSLLELDSTPSSDLISLLYAWITEDNSSSTNPLLSQRIEDFLTILSEETQFKMRVSSNNQSYEIVFQQEGIYESILKNEEVCSTDSKENVGAFRILKSAIKETMHSFIQDDKQKFMIKQDVTLDKFKNYAQMVSTYLNLIPKRTTSYELLDSDQLIEGSCIDHEQSITKCIPPHQRIFFGAPGTGKSYKLNQEANRYFKKNYARVTFHPSYMYGNFVGSFKPFVKRLTTLDGELKRDDDGNTQEAITYQYVAGILLQQLVKAYKDTGQNYLLVIDEINRANVASVFGDVFQLLDRDSGGYSEYEITTSKELQDYLKVELENVVLNDVLKARLGEDFSSLVLPPNLYIWATMNSADQGVMPMDTAFRRRWDFTYIGVNEAADSNQAKFLGYEFKVDENNKANWDLFRRQINRKLSTLGIPEDKLLGSYFIGKQILETKDLDTITNAIKNKVLMYLYEDAAKPFRSLLFAEDKFNTYSTICDNFTLNALDLFRESIHIDVTPIESDINNEQQLDVVAKEPSLLNNQ